MNNQTKTNQEFNITIAQDGELKFRGEIQSPEQFDAFQQALDESHRRSNHAQKLDQFLYRQRQIQGCIAIPIIFLLLTSFTFIVVRQISLTLQPKQAINYAQEPIS